MHELVAKRIKVKSIFGGFPFTGEVTYRSNYITILTDVDIPKYDSRDELTINNRHFKYEVIEEEE